MLPINDLVGNARYGYPLQEVVADLGGKEVLHCDYESSWGNGYVDLSVLLVDGRVFSYKYWYGSCPGCDDWEQRELTDTEIKAEMLKGATFFATLDSYNEWRAKQKKEETF